MWSLGCVLYELCMLQSAFTAEKTINRLPKILGGPYPTLPDTFPLELRDRLCELLQQDQNNRPSVGAILAKPLIIILQTKKIEKTVKELQTNLVKLRALADGLERVHQGTTIGSLTGGVIGAAGGITSIVGLILAPFTPGASLIVTGVGVGVAIAGAATAGVSNITNMVDRPTDQKAIKSITKEFQEKLNCVGTSLKDISDCLETLRCSVDTGSDHFNIEKLSAARVGDGLVGIPELVRLAKVANIGKFAAQTARAVHVAEVATGIFSGFLVAVDVFFIAMDAKEIHNIHQAKANEQPGNTQPKTELKSETMTFIQVIRQTADQLQNSLEEICNALTFIPNTENIDNLGNTQ
ncbi:apolipoprotein L3-like isoform X1 [Esox lucius]|uniref:apolipoprotein L3-like isoform X1 n=1 Tax=Esox lucius TaxID=8010 RepID=UPI001476F722|nr:apolipoprotein L3-like isoform X1 [Esox lucius]